MNVIFFFHPPHQQVFTRTTQTSKKARESVASVASKNVPQTESPPPQPSPLPDVVSIMFFVFFMVNLSLYYRLLCNLSIAEIPSLSQEAVGYRRCFLSVLIVYLLSLMPLYVGKGSHDHDAFFTCLLLVNL